MPILWALIGGSAAFLLGVRADLALLAAAIALVRSGCAIGIAHPLRTFVAGDRSPLRLRTREGTGISDHQLILNASCIVRLWSTAPVTS